MDKLWICVDCAFRSEYSEKQTDTHELDYLVATKLHKGVPQLYYSDLTDELETIVFSKSHCHFCGSILAGSRYSAVLYEGVIR